MDIFSPVTAPPTCKLNWDHIGPSQRQWFCSHCQHHVHNLSAMTKREARKFMAQPSTGRRCISFLQDSYGRAIFEREKLPVRLLRLAAACLTSTILTLLQIGCSKAAAQDQHMSQPTSPSPTPSSTPAPTPGTPHESINWRNLTNRPSECRPPLECRRWTGF
jgi:ribosomal protein L44E